MSRGDRVRLICNVKWDGVVYKKGTIGKITQCKASGYFLSIKGVEVYVFRGEVAA